MMDDAEQIAALRAQLIREPDDEAEKWRARAVMAEHANDLLAHALKAAKFEISARDAANRVLNDELSELRSARSKEAGLNPEFVRAGSFDADGS